MRYVSRLRKNSGAGRAVSGEQAAICAGTHARMGRGLPMRQGISGTLCASFPDYCGRYTRTKARGRVISGKLEKLNFNQSFQVEISRFVFSHLALKMAVAELSLVLPERMFYRPGEPKLLVQYIGIGS